MVAEEKQNFALIPKEEALYMFKTGYTFMDQAYPLDMPGSTERGQRVMKEIRQLAERTGLLYNDLTEHSGWPFEYATTLALMDQEMDLLRGLQFVDEDGERAELQRPLKKRCLSLSYHPEATDTLPIMPRLIK